MTKKAAVIGQLHEIEDAAALREIAEVALERARTTGRRQVAKGDRVRFTPSRGEFNGREIEGTVKRVNRKTATLEELEPTDGGEPGKLAYTTFRVPFSMLEQAEEVAA